MTQENRLREKIVNLIQDWDEYSGSDLADSILSAVRESLPKGQSVLPERLNSARFVMNGWNAYRKEMLKLLGAKDDGE